MTVPPATPAPDPGAPHFKREMSLFDAMMIVMGAMIGSGIFIVSADIARTVGSPGLLIVLLGVPVFLLRKRFARPAVEPAD